VRALPAGAPPEPPAPKGRWGWIVAGAGVVLLGCVVLVVCLALRDPKPSPDLEEVDPAALLVAPPGAPQDPRTEQAIRRGVTYLRQRVLGSEELYYFGETSDPHVGALALAGLTLLECGVPPNDAAVARAADAVRSRARGLRFTYSVALSILFLDGLIHHKGYVADPRDRALIKSMALQLIAAQQTAGGWDYQCEGLRPQEEESLFGLLRDRQFHPGDFRVSGAAAGTYHDNSIAQFATLALWAARKHGIPVEASLRVEETRYRNSQQDDGSWRYRRAVAKARDATTCCGLIGLAVGRGIRAEAQDSAGGKAKGRTVKEDVTRDPAIARGLDFLSRVIGRRGALSDQEKARREKHTRDMDELNRRLLRARERGEDVQPLVDRIHELDNDDLATGILFEADAWGDLYFLWSLERVAMVYDLQKLNGKDWYAWGKEVIQASQQPDGSWQERFPGVPDTCFALLFLRRANVARDLTDKFRRMAAGLGAAGPGPESLPPPPGRPRD
jgi:hypothetical protein